MTDTEIAIVGAGLAGLSCARALAKAGRPSIVFDKGRGVGGRLATRRAEGGLRFDHGAQFLAAQQPDFSAALGEMQRAGTAAPWDDGSGRDHLVGVPGMNAIAKHLAEGLDLRTGAAVADLEQTPDGWAFMAKGQRWSCRRLVITAPAPQVIALIGPDHPLSAEIAGVRMAPCWALMASFHPAPALPFLSRRDEADALSWIALDSSKPGRPDAACWIAHAAPVWSAENLEHDPLDIAAQMLEMLCERIGADPQEAVHAVAHRWRFASVSQPLGRRFARDPSGALYLGGDWCIGSRAEAAWQSGTAIAADLLRTG